MSMIPGGFTAASEYEVRYTYANGVVHECRSTVGSEWHGEVKDPSKQQHGIKFIGSERLDLGHAGRDQRQRPAILRRNSLPEPSGLYESHDHIGNFVDGVNSGNRRSARPRWVIVRPAYVIWG